MHKILFIHDEKCLPGALQDVQYLLNAERRLSGGAATSDLLAFLVMSDQAANTLLSQRQPSALSNLTDRTWLFGPDSVSMNGVWTLVTLTHPDVAQASKREEALVLLLKLLQAQVECHGRTLFPVYSSEESQLLIGDPLPVPNSASS